MLIIWDRRPEGKILKSNMEANPFRGAIESRRHPLINVKAYHDDAATCWIHTIYTLTFTLQRDKNIHNWQSLTRNLIIVYVEH